jgi:acetyl-CoA C-acetyltransferase
MGVDPRSPCLIGWAIASRFDGEPLGAWAEAARQALGAIDPAHVDSIDVVYCQSWPYDDPPARLAEALGATPRRARYSGIGGTTPQVLVAEAAEQVLAGALDVALVVGGEQLDTVRRSKKAGERPAWSHRDPERRPVVMDPPILPTEISHEVFQAWLTFATYDVAWRAHAGLSPDAHRAAIGRLFAPFTEVAAANPDAWFPTARTAEALAEVTPENRMVGFPYTKHLVSVMDVDMAAGVVLATHEAADRLGVPPDRRVHLRGIAAAKDPDHLPEHPEMWRSPAMAHVFGEALGRAGVEAAELDLLDLYSCFPSSVRFALDALGTHGFEADPVRPPTVTGGLPYFGGPGSGYVTHSLGQLVRLLREQPGTFGLASAVGMHMTNHAAAVLSTTPADGAAAPARARLEAKPEEAPMVDEGRGAAELLAYSVVHARTGEPEWALGVLALPDGTRCFGRATDADLLGSLEAEEWVGRTVDLTEGPGGCNLFRP